MGSRYLNLPQKGEIPTSMTKQFFNEENIPIKNKTIKEEEKLAKENVEIAITEALLNEDLKNIENGEVKEEKENKNKTFHLTSEKRLKNGPLGWLGIILIIFGLFLLIFDAFTNYLSQSNFGVSASLFSILLSVLNFISASRWPERISLIILLPFCTLTSFLFAFLGIESGQKLIIQPIPLGINCPPTKQFLPLIWFKWLKNSSITNIRRCINPAINSILLCFALIGGFLSLCSLLICCHSFNSFKNSKIKKLKKRISLNNKSMITSAHKPFNLLIAPAGRPRTKIPELPLIKKENRNNIN